jgi:hypothetical protein
VSAISGSENATESAHLIFLAPSLSLPGGYYARAAMRLQVFSVKSFLLGGPRNRPSWKPTHWPSGTLVAFSIASAMTT